MKRQNMEKLMKQIENSIDEHLKNTGIKTPLYQGQIEQFYYNWEGKVFFDRFMAIGKK